MTYKGLLTCINNKKMENYLIVNGGVCGKPCG